MDSSARKPSEHHSINNPDDHDDSYSYSPDSKNDIMV